MELKKRMSPRYRSIQSGLFSTAADADIGEGLGVFMDEGGDILAWADPFFPDHILPKSVTNAMQAELERGHSAQYTMPMGPHNLRIALAERITTQTALPIDPSRNILVTSGSDSALFVSMLPFLSEGDEVLVPEPCYPNNLFNPGLLGAVAVPVPLFAEDNYQIRIEELEQRLTDRTKLVVITHPNNPTTTVYRRDSIEALCNFIVKNDLILISDQAFQDHIFDGIEFVHPCALPGMWERTLTVASMSKGYALSGLRIGYVLACDTIMDVLYGVAQYVQGSPCTVSCTGALAALRDQTILPDYYKRFDRRRKLAFDAFGEIPGVVMRLSESGFVSWINIKSLGTDVEVADRLRVDARILVNAGSGFGKQGEGYLRIVTGCFLRDEDAHLRFMRIRAILMEMAREKGF